MTRFSQILFHSGALMALSISSCARAFVPSFQPLIFSREGLSPRVVKMHESSPSGDSAEVAADEKENAETPEGTLANTEHSTEPPKEPSIVQRCYEAWNNRDFDSAISCFSDKFTYDDGQYLGVITDKKTLKKSFERNAQIMPANSKMVIDNIAVDPNNGNIGSCWHVERADGSIVPLTRGCSFYTTDARSGKITSGFKVTEMVVKPNKSFSDNLVNSASEFIQASESLSRSDNPMADANQSSSTQQSEPKSIIEKYFQAWNKREMDAALDCFTEDATYQTEDPVFVDTFRGKDSLREHLLKNAKTLPSSCQILLDNLAIDEENGTFGVVWHLEVNGIGIPNLRGCSMYTMDKESGLLKSGYDVTESPVKVPGVLQDAFAPISKLLF